MRKSSPTRTWGRARPVALIVPLVMIVAACGALRPPAPPAPPIALYGDSLSVMSQPYYQLELQGRGVQADYQIFAGTAVCDWESRIVDAVSSGRYSVVELEFWGNSFTACMRGSDGTLLARGSPEWLSRYQAGIQRVFAAASARTRIVWATAPPDRTGTAVTDLTAIARAAAPGHNVVLVDTGASVSLNGDGQTYTDTLPCLADEGGSRGCGPDGRIQVRSADGVHFPIAPYSSGARRFGDALADAALASL